MKKSIASIAFAFATFAMIGSASAQLSLSGSTNGGIESARIAPALVAPAVVQQPDTLVAPLVAPQTAPYVQTPTVVVQPPIQQTVVPEAVVIPTPTYVVPSTCAFLPKLEFNGAMTYRGMQVVSVAYGGLAQRIGLEPGDVITSINGRAIHCEESYKRALFQAAVYGGGNVTLQVRNVRWTPGCLHTQKFVTIATQLPRRTIAAVPAIVAAR